MAAQVIIYDLAGRISVQGADVASKELGKVGKAAAEVKKTLKSVGEAGRHLGHAAMGIAILGVGAAGALSKMAHSAMEFEQKMAYVGALVGGKHTKAFEEFEMAARAAGITTMVSSTKAAEALYEIKKAGFDTKESIEFLNPALALSTLENIKVEKAAEIAASSLRGFGLNANMATQVVDAMAFTSKNTAASISNLGDGIRSSSATARSLGMDYKDLLVWLGLLNNANLKGSVAGTTLNSALLRLSGASVRGSKYVKELGISLTEGIGANAKLKPALQLIEEMGTKYNSILRDKGQVAATRTFMRALGQVGGKAVLAAFEAQAYQPMIARLKGIYNEKGLEGFAQQLAQRRYESTLGTVELLKNAFASFSIELSKANLFGGIFGEKLHKILGVMRLASAAVGGYKVAGRDKIMATFGLSEDTAVKVEKVVTGIKRGISEAVAYVEKMYAKATGMMKKQGSGINIEQVAATATKAVLAIATIGPAIFAAIPVIWALTGAIGGLFAAGKAMRGPGLGIIGLVAGMTAIGGSVTDAEGKSRGFFGNFVAGLRESNGLAKILLGSVSDIAKFLGVGGTIATVGALKVSAGWLGKALNSASTMTPGAGGAVAGAVGSMLSAGLPVEIVKWSAGLLTTTGGIPGLGGSIGAAAPGAAGAAGGGANAIGFTLGTVGSIVIAGTVGAIAGHALDEKFGLSTGLANQGPASILGFLLGGPAAMGAGLGLDKMFGSRPGRTDEENDRVARVYTQNERMRRTATEVDAIAEAWGRGQTMYGGERISAEMVRRRASEGLQGTGLGKANVVDLVEKWIANEDRWGTGGLPKNTEYSVQTELESLAQAIDTLNKGESPQDEIHQRQRDEEYQALQSQVQKLQEILEAIRNPQSQPPIYVEEKIMLDGQQIGSRVKQLFANDAARSGARPEGVGASQSTTEPMMSE